MKGDLYPMIWLILRTVFENQVWRSCPFRRVGHGGFIFPLLTQAVAIIEMLCKWEKIDKLSASINECFHSALWVLLNCFPFFDRYTKVFSNSESKLIRLQFGAPEFTSIIIIYVLFKCSSCFSFVCEMKVMISAYVGI